MLMRYISTGSYVNDCENGQTPITGYAVYTGFINQCITDATAYSLAQQNADYLRSFEPCASDPTTTTTTTTAAPFNPTSNLLNSGISYDWTDYFIGETGFYYDIAAWGATNGYLSGNLFENSHFTNLSASDYNGRGTVLAVMSNGGITGFGDNRKGFLNIPNINDAKQVSVGYDHCLVLRTGGNVTGWGTDQWGALSLLPRISGAIKVSAGLGSSIFLLDKGFITGSSKIGGNSYDISYPTGSGILNIDHSSYYVLLAYSGYVTGLGNNNLGISDKKYFNGISSISAGIIPNNLIVYNQGHITGYGTTQAIYQTPEFEHSLFAQMKFRLGATLNKDQTVNQWIYPYGPESYITSRPQYVTNNIVSLSQGANFAAVIFKRPCELPDSAITGYTYLWQLTGMDYYNGCFQTGDLFPPSGLVFQTCSCDSFNLPSISISGEQYSKLIDNCSAYSPQYTMYFTSILRQYPLININYAYSAGISKTGFAYTGITTGDYWNSITSINTGISPIYDSNQTLSSISGGILSITSGLDILLSVNNDTMFKTAISGVSTQFRVQFYNLQTGIYKILVYGHGSGDDHFSRFQYLKNGKLVDTQYTTGLNWDSSIWSKNKQFVEFNHYSLKNTDVVTIITSGYLNGIQFCNLNRPV